MLQSNANRTSLKPSNDVELTLTERLSKLKINETGPTPKDNHQSNESATQSSSTCTTRTQSVDSTLKVSGKTVATLCRWNITGNCQKRTRCKLIHEPCADGAECGKIDCPFGHPHNAKVNRYPLNVPKEKLQICPLYNTGQCPTADDMCTRTHRNCDYLENCVIPNCLWGHPVDVRKHEQCEEVNCCSNAEYCDLYECKRCCPAERNRKCPHASDCHDHSCRFVHPQSRYLCKLEQFCPDWNCTALHPPARPVKCQYAGNCCLKECSFLHPPGRAVCEFGKDCKNWYCRMNHPLDRNGKCDFGVKCWSPFCSQLHPPSRKACQSATSCKDITCKAIHPPGRAGKCFRGIQCWNPNCDKLHPDDWDPCVTGDDCHDWDCKSAHSPGRTSRCPQGEACRNRICKHLHPIPSFEAGFASPASRTTLRKKKLKSLHQRSIDRRESSLPIFVCREELCQRLRDEKILIVTAETGSGKTTQLPQYAAEIFGGLVICTQPRVMAAISNARRVAEEYDGYSVGESVGYQVGGNNIVKGSDIMFMTDAIVVQSAQIGSADGDVDLPGVSVLIIDEAHERTLNTDIVLGIAKLTLERRRTNFYVIISSATLDPTKFLKFFGCRGSVLSVPGRVYPVTVRYLPPSIDCTSENLIRSHVVPSLVNILKDHSEGHALVFLPGQKEIEQALKAFDRARPTNCVALPLYGSLAPEDQDRILHFNDATHSSARMVVFCTNVAETSITVPGVRLVIDSGLAKEARFDVVRRLTVLKLVYISRSSADQRKGRAGRTAPGHCVRLFSDDRLTRDNIEPEILRSSLDLVVLQILNLGMNPLNFPTIDPPQRMSLELSMEILGKFGSIEQGCTITNRGKLFIKLSLDPRLSAFVLTAHEQFGKLHLAAAIASILCAPGSVFFMGGANEEAKISARRRVAEGAAEHSSDLLYMFSEYTAWRDAGEVKYGRCIGCGKNVGRFQANGCRSCRIRHSKLVGLNNKVLDIIHNTTSSIMRIIEQSDCYETSKVCNNEKEQNAVDHNDIKAIGHCLKEVFPEHVGQVLVPNLPDQGARLIHTNIRARIGRTSAFLQRRLLDPYHSFVSMSITQNPSGEYFIDRLHPLLEGTQTNYVELICEKQNTSSILYKMFAKMFSVNSTLTAHKRKWLVTDHDPTTQVLKVYGRVKYKATLISAVSQMWEAVHSQLSAEAETVKVTETFNVTFQSGMSVAHVEEVRDPKIRTPRASNATNNEANGRVTFETHRDKWGKQLSLTAPAGTQLAEVKSRFRGGHTNIIQLSKHEECYRIDIQNWPPDKNESYLCNLIAATNSTLNGYSHKIDKPTIQIIQPRADTFGAPCAIISFKDKSLRDKVEEKLREELMDVIFTIEFRNKIDGRYTKHMSPQILPFSESQMNQFLLTFSDSQAAANMYTQILDSDWCLDGTSSVFIPFSDLFPKLDELVMRTRYECNVLSRIEEIKNRKGETNMSVRVTFYGGNPTHTSRAAHKLDNAVSSMTIQFSTEKEKIIFSELEKDDQLLQSWTEELGLKFCKLKSGPVKIYGPKINQGVLMRKIRDNFKKFEQNYRLIALSSEASKLFNKNSAGDCRLETVKQKWSGDCSVRYLHWSSCIEVYRRRDSTAEAQLACIEEIENLVAKLGGSTCDSNARCCVFCKSPGSGNSFTVCGHFYCECFSTNIQTFDLPVRCPRCRVCVHVRDVKRAAQGDFDQLSERALRKHFQNEYQGDRIFCFNGSCKGLIKKSLGYQQCGTCLHEMCFICNVVDNQLHEGKNCAEFAFINNIDFQVERLQKDAEDFVKENWPADMENITKIYRNPGLVIKPRCPSFQNFMQGMAKSDHQLINVPDGLFAFHGTAEQAIAPICHYGFDTTKRKGQAYGPGEYFGITANISHGFCRCSNKMIVAFLIKNAKMSTYKGSIYVMNNPVDDTCAYNLPILVVSYGRRSTGPVKFLSPPVTSSAPMGRTTFRWSWQTDSLTWAPYTDQMNSFIETSYEKFKSGDGSSIVTLPAVTRNVDKRSQSYEIDFEKLIQKNTATSYKRRIQRECIIQAEQQQNSGYLNQRNTETTNKNECTPSGPVRTQSISSNKPEQSTQDFSLQVRSASYGRGSNGSVKFLSPPVTSSAPMGRTTFRWSWQTDSLTWAPYTDQMNSFIETSYEKFKSGDGSSIITLLAVTRNVDKRSQSYEIDFEKLIQKNTATSYKRRIQRECIIQAEQQQNSGYLNQRNTETTNKSECTPSGPGGTLIISPNKQEQCKQEQCRQERCKPEQCKRELAGGSQTNINSTTATQICQVKTRPTKQERSHTKKTCIVS